MLDYTWDRIQLYHSWPGYKLMFDKLLEQYLALLFQ